MKPKPGEALTSYLFRISDANGCEVKDIWKTVQQGPEDALMKNQISRLEYDLNIVDHTKLGSIMGLSIGQLEAMSFRPLYKKFFDDPNIDYQRAAVMIRSAIVINKRRYCPACIIESSSLKLIWQVKEIEICTEHQIRLQSNCPHCSRPVKYSDNILSIHKCHDQRCNYYLLDVFEKVEDEDLLQQQFKCFAEWNFLLHGKEALTKNYKHLSLEQSLALKVLYVAQHQPEKYIRNQISFLSMSIIKSLVSLVRNKSNLKKVSIKELLLVTRQLKMNLEDFIKVSVPVSYLDSIFEKKKIHFPSVCLASWCRKYRNSSQMIMINNRIEPRRKGVRYPHYYVCTSCFMKYGYNPKTDQWEEVQGKISMLKKVARLASMGKKRSEVAKHMKMNIYLASELFGYLAYHHILPANIKIKYIPQKIPTNLANCFKELDCDWHTYPWTRYQKAKKLFNWSVLEYSYYFANHAVQHYFMMKPSSLKRPLKKYRDIGLTVEQKVAELMFSEINITLDQVAASLECKDETLRSRGLVSIIEQAKEKQRSIILNEEETFLRRKFDLIIMECRESGMRLIFKNVYNVLGRSRDYIKLRHPGLFDYIQRMANAYNESVRLQEWDALRVRVKKAVRDMKRTNLNLTAYLVSKQLNISDIHLTRKRKIKNLIIEEIDNFNIE